VDEQLVDVAKVLEHDVELSDDRVPVPRCEMLFALANDVVQSVVVALKQNLHEVTGLAI
jgi:hypothetical protein